MNMDLAVQFLKLKEENDKLKEVLKYYANTPRDFLWEDSEHLENNKVNVGKRARAVLNELDNVQNDDLIVSSEKKIDTTGQL